MKVFLADTLSLLRVAMTVVLLVFALQGKWEWAFLTLIVAWGTDLLDGYLARKFGSFRDIYPQFDADGIADSVLAFGSSAVPVIYAWGHAPSGVTIVLVELYLASIVVGSLMVKGMGNPKSPKTKRLIKVNMPIFHGLLQIVGVMAWFAYMAYGWNGVLVTCAGAVFVAYSQRGKLLRWFAGALR